MTRPMTLLAATVFVAGLMTAGAADKPPATTIRIDATQPRTQVSPRLYGIFFEEINHAGEGGLYAEMVQNRDFEMTTLPKGATWAGNLRPHLTTSIETKRRAS